MVAANIPASVYMRNKQLFGGDSEFIKYVVCPECHLLYKEGAHIIALKHALLHLVRFVVPNYLRKLSLEMETEGFTHTWSTLMPA